MLKVIAYLFLISQFTLLNPYAESLYIYGRCLTGTIFLVLLYVGNIKLSKKERNVLLLLTIPFCVFMLIQSVFTQEIQPFKNIASYAAESFSAMFVYKVLGFKKIFKFFLFFVLLNCIAALVWALEGRITIDSTTNKLYVQYLTLLQPLYPVLLDSNGFSIFRLAGFTANPNCLAMLGAFCYIYKDFVEVNKIEEYITGFMIVTMLLVTQSRGAFLFIAVYYFFVILSNNAFSFVKKSIALIMIFAMFIGVMNFGEIRDGSEDMTSGRSTMSNIAFYGFDRSADVYQIVGIPYNLNEYLWKLTHEEKITIDNSYLANLISLGYLGIAINYFFFFYTWLYVLFNSSGHKSKMVVFYIALLIYGGIETIFFTYDRGILYEFILLNAVTKRI